MSNIDRRKKSPIDHLNTYYMGFSCLRKCLPNKIILLIAFQFAFGFRFIYSQKYFIPYSIKDGLSQSQVYAIYQDSRGYLWVGTYGGGVNRYDGISFTHYSTKDGLCNNVVYSIGEDGEGNLWFGTDGGGISVFNGYDFTTIGSEDGLKNEHVYSIIQGNNGEMWVGTYGGGVFMIQPRASSGAPHFSIMHYGVEEGLVNDSVLSMIKDSNGDLWVGTAGGASWIANNPSGSENSYELTKQLNFTESNGLYHNVVNVVYEDHNENIWFGTFGGGLNILMQDNRGGTQRNRDRSQLQWKYITANNGLCDNRVTSLFQDKEGYMWAGTYGGGLCKTHSDSALVSQVYFIPYTSKEGLDNSIIWTIAQDRSGNMWLGSEGGGLYKYAGETFTHFNTDDGLNSNIVFSILEDRNNNIWLGNYEGGITVIHADDRQPQSEMKIKNYTTANGLTSNNVATLFDDKTARIWIGTYSGISIYEKDKFYRLNLPQLNNSTILTIYQSKSGMMWAGTDDGGVFRFDVKDMKLSGDEWSVDASKIKQITVDDGLNSNIIWAITEDRHGNMWLGTWAGGVSKLVQGNTGDYKIENITEKDGLGNNSVLTILEGDYGEMWFATYGGGISVLTGSDGAGRKQWHYITTQEGLNDDGVVSMVFDDEGNLWVGTNKGINKIVFDLQEEIRYKSRENVHQMAGYHIKQYGKLEGFVGIECNQKAIYKDRKGNIWVGTANLLSRYNAKTKQLNLIEPLTHIRGLRIFFDEINWNPHINLSSARGGQAREGRTAPQKPYEVEKGLEGVRYSGSNKWNNLPQNLILPYYQNHITFDFIGISLKIPEKIRYQYLLKGLDKDWSPPVKENFATYPKLPPGEYTFMVKARNDDGIWNSEPATYHFVITPPFWETWWFYLICAIVAAASVYTAILIRIRNLLNAKKILEKQVKLRTNQLREEKILVEKQKVELEITHNNLNKTYNKLKELEVFKDSMMGMIVHDLKNPLNAILSFSKYKPTINLLTNIYRAGRKMLNLVMNILDIQKFEEAEMKLKLDHHLMDSALNEAIQQVEASAIEKGLEIKNIVKSDITAKFDFDIIARVVVNLLTNAVKFTPAGGEITTSADHYLVDDLEMIRVNVVDTGDGIPEDKLHTVFDRFSQVESKDLGNTASTGIGLTFCKLAVEAHGGTISVNSQIGKGSMFYFTLPKGDKGKIKISKQKTNETAPDIEPVVDEPDNTEKAKEPVFNAEEKKYFLPFIAKFKGLTVYHTSYIMEILNQMQNDKIIALQRWKDEMQTAIYNCNEKRFEELMGMVKGSSKN